MTHPTPSRSAQNKFDSFLRDESSITFPGLHEIFDWIELTLEPQDVFGEKQLEEWATINGYAKGGNDE